MVEGKGSWLTDNNGKRYLDFLQGWAVNCLGHCNSGMIEALNAQAKKLINPSPAFYNEPMIGLSNLLTQNSCFNKVFFANSGAEVAAAFADIAAGKTAGNSLKGSYSGTLTAFSTGSAQGSKVEFTSTTTLDVNAVPLVQGGTATTPTISTIPGLEGGGITLEGAFSKAGTLSILAGGEDSVTSAKFTLEDGQTLDISSGVTGERQGQTFGIASSGSANAMDVDFRIRRHIHIDHGF